MSKKRKTNLKSTILLLLLAAILLIASTYAWFTSNKTVTISTIDVNVAAVNGLQISTDASNWKSIITKAEIIAGYSNSTNQVPSVLEPCSTSKQYDSSTGFMKMYHGTVTDNETTGAYQLATTLQTETQESGETATGKFVAFDMFLKVDQETTIYLTTASAVTGASNDDTSRGLQNAARVAFVKEGNKATGTSVSELQGLKALDETSADIIIWEPNNNAHTASAISNAYDTYGNTITSTDVVSPYYGVNSAFEGVALSNTDSTYFTSITSDISTGTTMDGYQEFTTLAAGVTKYRVYMWIEGQDVDCENNASGSNLNFDLQFSVNSSATN
jgi:predicted ribosomally synthesized peptide with SipW-like signal peptide